MKTKHSIKKGDRAKAKTWKWGGRVTAVNKKSVFIQVGNEETGETYEVPREDCEKIVPSGIQNALLVENAAAGRMQYIFAPTG